MTEQQDFDLVPTHLAVQAMRDNGYRNTAYAVAELIDNSLQAGATSVELLCCENVELVNKNVSRRIKQIAVLDNGHGMSADVLQVSLQFGNGTHLKDRSGIGRFGMGLPSASISQCQRVDVWSWQDGIESALYTYIDLAEVERGLLRSVPMPTPKPIPDQWKATSAGLGDSGTLVVWSRLDRCMWRTAKSIIDNSEFIIARMYRKFLADGRASIRMAAFNEDDRSCSIERFAVANDPGYLLVPSSTPAPYDSEPMFQPDGDHWEVTHQIEYRGEVHPVHIRFSYAKESVRAAADNVGRTLHGAHAGKNIGISIMRADRELDLDEALVLGYDPRERWWGVEVDFPPALDELFGVTNNKQAARNFSELANNLKNLDKPEDYHRLVDERKEDEDPTGPLLEILHLIDRRLRTLRQLLKVQTSGNRAARRRFDDDAAEVRATEITRQRQKQGFHGASDSGENLPDEDRAQELKQELIESGLAEEQAEELAARTISSGVKYTFAETALDGSSFFTVRPVAGEIVIKVNISHPAYRNLVEVLEEDVDEALSEVELRSRLLKAHKGLKLLLMAWARYEDEQPNDTQRQLIQDIRVDWGRVAARFLQSGE